MKRIRIVSFVLIFCLLLGEAAYAAGGFCDVPESHWAYENIQKAASLGIIQGYAPDAKGNVYFKPSGSVTVGAGYVMVQRTMVLLGLLSEADPIESGTPAAARVIIADYAAEKMEYPLSPMAALRYTDAGSIERADAFYLDALYRYGIMQGYTDGSFGPQTTINRAQFAAICIRMAELTREEIAAQEVTNLVGTLGSVDAEGGEFVLTAEDSEYRCLLADGAELYIDGALADLGSLSACEGQSVCVGCIAGTNSVSVSTNMQIVKGQISDVMQHGDFLSFVCGGASYYADSSSLGTISEGTHSFVAEGTHIIEFK